VALPRCTSSNRSWILLGISSASMRSGTTAGRWCSRSLRWLLATSR
jgi:hypothetical protein